MTTLWASNSWISFLDLALFFLKPNQFPHWTVKSEKRLQNAKFPTTEAIDKSLICTFLNVWEQPTGRKETHWQISAEI